MYSGNSHAQDADTARYTGAVSAIKGIIAASDFSLKIVQTSPLIKPTIFIWSQDPVTVIDVRLTPALEPPEQPGIAFATAKTATKRGDFLCNTAMHFFSKQNNTGSISIDPERRAGLNIMQQF